MLENESLGRPGLSRPGSRHVANVWIFPACTTRLRTAPDRQMDEMNNNPGAFRLDNTWSVRGLRGALFAAAAALSLLTGDVAQAASFREGVSAFKRQDFLLASQNFFPLAEYGDPAAQTYLSFMIETGHGVPRNYTEAAMSYRRAPAMFIVAR
jgi:hypothetical protein